MSIHHNLIKSLEGPSLIIFVPGVRVRIEFKVCIEPANVSTGVFEGTKDILQFFFSQISLFMEKPVELLKRDRNLAKIAPAACNLSDILVSKIVLDIHSCNLYKSA